MKKTNSMNWTIITVVCMTLLIIAVSIFGIATQEWLRDVKYIIPALCILTGMALLFLLVSICRNN
jgi:hypothetical protein